MLRTILACILAAGALAPPCRAELRATEVAIVAARGNDESVALAEHYANARAIPVSRICQIDVPDGDECPRDQWNTAIRPAIRQWLDESDPDGQIRCLTTVWGVPLRIAPEPPTAAQVAYQQYLAGERLARVALLRAAVAEFEGLVPAGEISTDAAGAGAGAPAVDLAAITDDLPPDELRQQFQRALDLAIKGAQARIKELAAGPARSEAQTRLQQGVAAAGGASVILQNLEQQLRGGADPAPALTAEIQRLRGAGAAWVEAREVLERRPPGIDRDVAILGIVERIGGHLAAIRWLDQQLAVVALAETAASFDSELALVRWSEPYELLRWQPNYLNRQFDASHLRRAFPTLMVARIDAPTVELARSIVDASIEVEREGLAGKAYVDARGLGQAGQTNFEAGSPADFDQALLNLAAGIDAQTTVDMLLNDRPALFAADECPEAALYCGWYSLGKYVDAFQWQRGAVAWHAGGAEAAALHSADSQRWCKRLLEDGVAATIGGVDEPYVEAFPRPDEFFALVMRGDQTLAECYWQTVPHASWSLTLIGDPLYRPFKNRRVQVEEPTIR